MKINAFILNLLVGILLTCFHGELFAFEQIFKGKNNKINFKVSSEHKQVLIETNKMLKLKVGLSGIDQKTNQILASSDLQLWFDARMPEHNHGMMVKPEIKKVAPLTFVIEGVKLHMTGDWDLQFKAIIKSSQAKSSINGMIDEVMQRYVAN